LDRSGVGAVRGRRPVIRRFPSSTSFATPVREEEPVDRGPADAGSAGNVECVAFGDDRIDVGDSPSDVRIGTGIVTMLPFGGGKALRLSMFKGVKGGGSSSSGKQDPLRVGASTSHDNR
jgi:hypothetical protein